MAKHFEYNVTKIKVDDKFIGIPSLMGKNLYETAVEYGYQGTEDEWFNMLITDGWVSVYQAFHAEFEAFVEETYNKFVTETYANFVQTILTRTINGRAFDKDITLTPKDIGAADKSLSNVSVQDFTTKAQEAGFEASVGVETTQTVFNADGSITETLSSGEVKKTVFNADGSITENYTLTNGDTVTKTITFGSSSITETIS